MPGRRLALTKSVLSALPAYLMSCIKLPQWVIKEIDRIQSFFFLERQEHFKPHQLLGGVGLMLQKLQRGRTGHSELANSERLSPDEVRA